MYRTVIPNHFLSIYSFHRISGCHFTPPLSRLKRCLVELLFVVISIFQHFESPNYPLNLRILLQVRNYLGVEQNNTQNIIIPFCANIFKLHDVIVDKTLVNYKVDLHQWEPNAKYLSFTLHFCISLFIFQRNTSSKIF